MDGRSASVIRAGLQILLLAPVLRRRPAGAINERCSAIVATVCPTVPGRGENKPEAGICAPAGFGRRRFVPGSGSVSARSSRRIRISTPGTSLGGHRLERQAGNPLLALLKAKFITSDLTSWPHWPAAAHLARGREQQGSAVKIV